MRDKQSKNKQTQQLSDVISIADKLTMFRLFRFVLVADQSDDELAEKGDIGALKVRTSIVCRLYCLFVLSVVLFAFLSYVFVLFRIGLPNVYCQIHTLNNNNNNNQHTFLKHFTGTIRLEGGEATPTATHGWYYHR